jgi:hypothetical protein
MSHQDEKPLRGVGVYWIDEADYGAVVAGFEDGATMPPSWAEWQKMAIEMETGLKAYGHPVMRVRIKPSEFADWCAAHGVDTGRAGRKAYIAEAVFERWGDQS